MKVRNPVVVLLSVVALACIALTFFVDWLFIVPAVAIFFINNRLLRKK